MAQNYVTVTLCIADRTTMRPTALVSRDWKAQGEHDNCAARYERRTDIRAFPFAIRIDSIQFVMRIDSNLFVL